MTRPTLLAIALLAVGCADDDPDPDNTSCTTQMYAKYGQAGFEAVNAKILENVVAVSSMSPSPIGDSFKGLSADDVARVEANLLDFLIAVYGGPDNYTGEDMETAHVGLGITSEQYDAFVGMVIVPALQAVGVAGDDITNCFAPPVVDPAFKATMVGK
jgi:hemoglobin